MARLDESLKPEIVVVKVGTSTLLSYDDQPSLVFESIASAINQLRQHSRVVLVTSGAIGFGVQQLGLDQRPELEHLDQLQALSMFGQTGLMQRWQSAFKTVPLGQVLTTRRDLENEHQRKRLLQSVAAVWQFDGVPVVNENDAISTSEIKFGDNDQLAAELAIALKSKTLFLLTNQDGIQTDFGTPAQQRLKEATVSQARCHVTDGVSTHGTGGAASKLMAAQHALRYGAEQVFIAQSGMPDVFSRVMAGEAGTKLVS